MNQSTLQSALEVLNSPDKVRLLIGASNDASLPAFSVEVPNDAAANLLVAIAEDVSQENGQFATIYQAVKQKNEAVNRDIPIVFDYLTKAYGFLKDHWAEIYFIIAMLNKKGYFKELKKDKDLKTFFEVFFDEEIKEDTNEGK